MAYITYYMSQMPQNPKEEEEEDIIEHFKWNDNLWIIGLVLVGGYLLFSSRGGQQQQQVYQERYDPDPKALARAGVLGPFNNCYCAPY